MPKNEKKDEGLFEILVKLLFEAIKWTIIYYVTFVAAIAGLGGTIVLIDKLKKSKK